MHIKTKLAIRFTLIVMLILTVFSGLIYYFSQKHRKEIYYDRLEEGAINAGHLFIRFDDLDPTLLSRINKNAIDLFNKKRITVYNQDLKVIYQSGSPTLQVDNNELNKVLQEKQHRFVLINEDGVEEEGIGLYFHAKEGNYLVFMAGYDNYGFIRLNFLRVMLTILWFIGLVTSAIASWLYSKNSLKPISRVINEVQDIDANNLEKRVDEGNGTDEIATLAITFNKMLKRIESSFKMQQTFVSNASHELRTPLTSITGQIEVALLNERTQEEYIEILESVLEDIQNLNKLTQRLLDLAQVNIEDVIIPFKQIRIDELLLSVRGDLTKIYKDININIFFEKLPDDERRLRVYGNDHLIRICFQNIIENAYKYSNDKSLLISFNVTDDSIQIHFKDSGVGIAEADIDKIIEPFFRSSNTTDIKGHGIGLSLTNRIISLHKGKITIASKLEKGTCVTLELPISEL